jgi:hypothetical protein
VVDATPEDTMRKKPESRPRSPVAGPGQRTTGTMGHVAEADPCDHSLYLTYCDDLRVSGTSRATFTL